MTYYSNTVRVHYVRSGGTVAVVEDNETVLYHMTWIVRLDGTSGLYTVIASSLTQSTDGTYTVEAYKLSPYTRP